MGRRKLKYGIVCRLALVLLVCFFTIISVGAETTLPTSESENFIDNTHDVLANTFYWPLAWVDNFFMSEGQEFETNQSFFRVIGNYVWVNNEGFTFRPQFRMKVRLKALQRKLSLIAFGENNDESSSNSALGKKTEITPVEKLNSQSNRVGLRYNVLEWFDSRFDADVVVSKKLVPEPSLRARQIIKYSKTTQSRLTVLGFWEKELRFGQTTRLDLAHQFAKRWAYDIIVTGKQSQHSPALAWDNSINTSVQLSPREALALHLQASGPTRPHTIVQNYRTSIVYRRNFYRPWIFYEVEPGVDWPYISNHRKPVWSTVFRMELQFKSS